MKYTLIYIAFFFSSISTSLASSSTAQSNEFIKLYSSLCLKHLYKIETLRNKLSKAPQFPPDKAALFLSGKEGNAWPIPSNHGNYVLSLHKESNFCAVFSKQGKLDTAEKSFIKLVGNAPSPLISERLNHGPNSANLRSITYQWYKAGTQRGLLFKLTTNSDNSQDGNIRLMASASTVSL